LKTQVILTTVTILRLGLGNFRAPTKKILKVKKILKIRPHRFFLLPLMIQRDIFLDGLSFIL
jgi:hypothetical protein